MSANSTSEVTNITPENKNEESDYIDDFHSESETSNFNSHENSKETKNKDETKTSDARTDHKKNETKTNTYRAPISTSSRHKKNAKDSSINQRKQIKINGSAKKKTVIPEVRVDDEEKKRPAKRDSARRNLRINSNSRQRNASRSTSNTKRSVREGSGKSVHWYSSDEISEESSSTDSEKDENRSRELRPELTAEYWDIHKLVRFLKVGNPTVTLIALCALDDFNLHQETTQLSVVDLGGIAILLNLLNTKYISCVIGSLKILLKLSKSRIANNEIYRLKGVQQIIDSLSSCSLEVQSLAAGTLANFASFRRAYSAVRRYKGISILVNILENTRYDSSVRSTTYTTNKNTLQSLRKNVCEALWSCSRCSKNIPAIREAGSVSVLSSLLNKGSNDMILCCVGIIQECSSNSSFRDDIRKEGIIEDVVRLLKSGDNELKTLCANVIFKCGDEVETQKLVLKHDGLEPLVEVLKCTTQYSDKNLLSAVAGAIWKCGSYKINIERLEYLDTITHLIKQLKHEQPLEVEANIIGALSIFAYNRKNIKTIYEEGVLHIVINKLNVTDPNVLINSTRILALCAKEDIPRREILTSDGVRLLWSLLKSSNHKVVANGAYGIAMCVSNALESAEIVRSFVGGLELVTRLLRSNRREVLISVCQMVINIGQDRENMSIMTDYDIIPLLISLVYADDEELHQYVAEAIATCCNLEENIQALSPTVIPLSDGFRTYNSVEVHRTTALALEKLSNNPRNCFIIYKNGAIKHLLKMMASQDHAVQEAAARCIKNVRMNIKATVVN